MLRYLSTSKRSFILMGLLLLMAITFETLQQLFYINRFQLGVNVTFWDVLQSQSYRWIIWVLLGGFLAAFAWKKRFEKLDSIKGYTTYLLFIIVLVIINVVIISCIQNMANGDSFVWETFLSDYIAFYTYQKAPIYTLGYIAMATIFHLYFVNEQLQIKIHELVEIKNTNEAQYQKLIASNNDRTQVINIKIGNKRKIIPIEKILWIEADDYCVNVHLMDNKTYAMRSSLKTLEEKLQDPFLRVHRKAIVNMKMAKELNTAPSPFLTLSNNTEIPVSKSNLKAVRGFIS
ncbi:MAG: LytTR family DNA-binding domain-containing protein [Bacteroidota bacterium]